MKDVQLYTCCRWLPMSMLRLTLVTSSAPPCSWYDLCRLRMQLLLDCSHGSTLHCALLTLNFRKCKMTTEQVVDLAACLCGSFIMMRLCGEFVQRGMTLCRHDQPASFVISRPPSQFRLMSTSPPLRTAFLLWPAAVLHLPVSSPILPFAS